MWPVQTLTLLLCLTDDEQLFAQAIPVIDETGKTEQVVAVQEEAYPADTLVYPMA
ncbi:MAG: hypothetical protein KBA60_04725 [Flavobacteriales bacterium]|nr:hypothetical protein [Flavobacteriales bacterium]MBP6643635.1 hypothetical protein [Flavobacteriales bacterium]MBP7155289.1 hypothetical protein [Flavobacteriales bacterium]HQV76080.1 hypothetical protein [Flavobacteriales bacterium]HQW40852.1 hypothetical protein [Flavobacteriales bacterium]